MSAGGIGAIAGLILGLVANPPTAWFAVFEVGLPAAVVGGVIGLIAGLVTSSAGRVVRPHARVHE
jgi:ABC-type uncharacterized transport system permease subunit